MKSRLHNVELIHSGRSAFWKVTSQDNHEVNVSMEVHCSCEYHALHSEKGELCSYVLAIFREVIAQGKMHCHYSFDTSMIQRRRNEALQLIRPMNRKVNEKRSSTGESDRHRIAKETVCNLLEAQKKEYVTEAIFIDGQRADIFVLDDFEVIEIVVTESEESIANKRLNYPQGIKLTAVKA